MTKKNQTPIKNRLGIQLITRDRHPYMAVLLASIKSQTFKGWDIFIVDNGTIPLEKDYLTMSILRRMQFEGHRVKIEKNTELRDIGALRNIALDMDDCEFGIRIDDDSYLEPDCFEKIWHVLMEEPNAGCVGGIVPYMAAELHYREMPKLFNEIGEFFDTADDSVWGYNTDTYHKTDHIRSTFAYNNKWAREIRHPEWCGRSGFREETIFSYAFKLFGFDNYIVPSAKFWHIVAPSGGGRDLDKPMDKIKWDNDAGMKKQFKYIKELIEKYGKEDKRKIMAESEKYVQSNL